MDEQGGESMTTTHMNAHFTILGSCRAGCNLVSGVQRKEKRKSSTELQDNVWFTLFGTGNIL